MSNSKPLPTFTFDVLCCFNRDQLERFSIVCRPLKNLIERYFHSKPYRVFSNLRIRGGSYALSHENVQWHPNRDDYSIQQFLAGQICSIDIPLNDCKYYSFAKMNPYLGPTIRINWTTIDVPGYFTYNPEHIAEMESIVYLWRNGNIRIKNPKWEHYPMDVRDFLPILNSPTILQCQKLSMDSPHFSLKDHKVLYTVNVIEIEYCDANADSLSQFLEQPGVKPLVVSHCFRRKNITNIIDRLCRAFSCAVLPNSFKIVFVLFWEKDEPLTEFVETNKTLSEKLELMKGLPSGYEADHSHVQHYTLERSSI